jgi:hypothetical protein
MQTFMNAVKLVMMQTFMELKEFSLHNCETF